MKPRKLATARMSVAIAACPFAFPPNRGGHYTGFRPRVKRTGCGYQASVNRVAEVGNLELGGRLGEAPTQFFLETRPKPPSIVRSAWGLEELNLLLLSEQAFSFGADRVFQLFPPDYLRFSDFLLILGW